MMLSDIFHIDERMRISIDKGLMF